MIKLPMAPYEFSSVVQTANKNTSTLLRTERLERFRTLAQKVKSISKGATKPGARILQESYWKEVSGLNLIIDGKMYKGHMYMGFFQEGKSKYWKDWTTGADETGIPYSKLFSFEQYMNNPSRRLTK